MASRSLYEICRLCMTVLDRDAIDCSKQENCELRENIEMIYNVKVKIKATLLSQLWMIYIVYDCFFPKWVDQNSEE